MERCNHPTKLPNGAMAGPPCRKMIRIGAVSCGEVNHIIPPSRWNTIRDSLAARNHIEGGSFSMEEIIFGMDAIKQARELEIDPEPTLSEAYDQSNVEGSTNDWCLSRTETIEAADVVIIREPHGMKGPGEVEVLLIRRGNPPFMNDWALPGGMRDEGESLQETAQREMGEEVNLHFIRPSGTWLGEEQSTLWDPRFTKTHVGAMLYKVPDGVRPSPGDDAIHVEWVRLEDIANGSKSLAFGHAEWIYRGVDAVGDNSFLSRDLSRRLGVVRDLAKIRNRRLVEKVNSIRKDKNSPLIPV